MHSFEFVYQMKRLSIDSIDSMLSPPEVLSLSMMSSSTADSQEYELDCSRFASMMQTPSFQSSSAHQHSIERRMSNERWGSSGLSRNRCVHNLSALGSASAADVSCSSRKIPSYESTPNVGWGYFVDTPSGWGRHRSQMCTLQGSQHSRVDAPMRRSFCWTRRTPGPRKEGNERASYHTFASIVRIIHALYWLCRICECCPWRNCPHICDVRNAKMNCIDTMERSMQENMSLWRLCFAVLMRSQYIWWTMNYCKYNIHTLKWS
jgi:hypothetical protein